jgi:hypothetical protein
LPAPLYAIAPPPAVPTASHAVTVIVGVIGAGVEIGVAVGVALGVGATVAPTVSAGVGETVGATVEPHAARPRAAIAEPMTMVTFIFCLYPFNANTSSAVTRPTPLASLQALAFVSLRDKICVCDHGQLTPAGFAYAASARDYPVW